MTSAITFGCRILRSPSASICVVITITPGSMSHVLVAENLRHVYKRTHRLEQSIVSEGPQN